MGSSVVSQLAYWVRFETRERPSLKLKVEDAWECVDTGFVW